MTVYRTFGVVKEDGKLLDHPICIRYNTSVVFLFRVDRVLEHLNGDVVAVVRKSLHELLHVALTKFQIDH